MAETPGSGRGKRSDFVHLNVHSHYSLLDATCRIDDMVSAAAQQGAHALALTDSGNLFGAIEFYQKARKKGIKPIIGAELFVTDESHKIKDRQISIYNLTVLVQNYEGYKNLTRLTSFGYLEGFYYRPRIDVATLRTYAKGLIALSGNSFGKVPRLLLMGRFDEAVAAAREYAEIFEGRFHLEIQNHGLDDERLVGPQLMRLSKETGIELVATNQVRHLRREDAYAREILKAIGKGKPVRDTSSLVPANDQYYLKSPAEMREFFQEIPRALERTVEIADECNLELDFSAFHLPKFTIPDGTPDFEYLEILCREAAKRKYSEWTEAAEDRLKFELQVIQKMGFSSYFLIVWDFIRFAKTSGIPVGPGRGSAAGSMVAYLLEITDLCPLRYGLFFERFLNPGRISMPDIDIDFCETRRSEVIDYVRDKYGKDNVCQIITFGVLKPKAALKDVARILNVPFLEANRITAAVPPELNITLEESLATSADLRKFADTYPELFQIAAALEGCVRNSSTHAAGVVITPDKLWELIPIYQRDDQVATQYTMKWLESVGVLKMDFLGLSTLTIIQKAIRNIQHNRGLALDIAKIPLSDKRTFKLLSSGETAGVFTFETSIFRDLLKRLKPTVFEDLVAAQALGRPGPLSSGMVDEYIEIKHGHKKVSYPHPALEEILKETHGVFIYQEQVMQCANVLAGYSLAEADGLRRAMGKKIPEEMQKHRERFVKGAVERHIKETQAEEIFSTMEKFAAYGFNKSHSACYALVSYQTAYLKSNFPAEFMAALLTVEMGNTDKVAMIVDECTKLKIEVLPPDINESGIGFTVHGQKIRFGLGAVRNMGESVARAILAARKKHGHFKNLEEFCKAVDTKTVNRRAVESLIKCGAFKDFSENRAQLLAVIDQAFHMAQDTQKHHNTGQGTLMDFFSRQNIEFQQSLLSYPEIPDFSDREVLNFEKELLGLYLSGHPLHQYGAMIDRMSLMSVVELEPLQDGATFMVCGIIKSVRKIRIKSSGKDMAVILVEDLKGAVELALFSEVLEGYGDQIVDDHLVVIWGKISQRRDGQKRTNVEGLAALETLMINREFEAQVVMTSNEDDVTRDQVAQIRNILLANQGRHPVFWNLRTAEWTVTVRLGKDYKVTPGRDFVEAIEKVLGMGAVRLKVTPPFDADAKKEAGGPPRPSSHDDGSPGLAQSTGAS